MTVAAGAGDPPVADETELGLAAIAAIEGSFRARARQCRRYGWIFLASILVGIVAVSFLVWEFFADAKAAQSQILGRLSEQLEAARAPIDQELSLIGREIAELKEGMRLCLTELGACFRELDQPGLTDAWIKTVVQFKGQVLATARGDWWAGDQIWRSDDGAAHWSKEELPQNFSLDLKKEAGRLVILGQGLDPRIPFLAAAFGSGVHPLFVPSSSPCRVFTSLSAPDPRTGAMLVFADCDGEGENGSSLDRTWLIDHRLLTVDPLPDLPSGSFGAEALFRRDSANSTFLIQTGTRLRRGTLPQGAETWELQDVPGSGEGTFMLIDSGQVATAIRYDSLSEALVILIFDQDLRIVTRLDCDLSGEPSELRDQFADWQRDQETRHETALERPAKNYAGRLDEARLRSVMVEESAVRIWLEQGRKPVLPRAIELRLGQGSWGAKILSDVPIEPGTAMLSFRSDPPTLREWPGSAAVPSDGIALPPWGEWPVIGFVGRTADGWILVTDNGAPAERGLDIWRWRPGVGWQLSRLPVAFDIRESFGGWQATLSAGRLALYQDGRGGRSRIFLSETTEVPSAVFTDDKALRSFLQDRPALASSVWPEYRKLLDKLTRQADLKGTSANLAEALAPITEALKGSSTKDGGAAGLIRSFTAEYLVIAFSRLLIIALVFFAIRLLTNLYRYFMTLSAYYDARADGLALARLPAGALGDRLPKNLTEIFGALSPDGVDLGQAPNSPVNDIVEAATKLADAAARAVSGKGGG